MNNARRFIFLKDVFHLGLTAFGGPQVHTALFLELLCKKRAYVTEKELLELNALCQVLPGPSSTQMITAVGYKKGGVSLALLTLLVWSFPAICIMTGLALLMLLFKEHRFSVSFLKIVQPVAIAFVLIASFRLGDKIEKTKTSYFLFAVAGVASFLYQSPYLLPLLVVGGGLVSALKFKKQEKEEKIKFNIKWRFLIIYGSLFVLSAALGGLTHSLIIRLFENFYRNGSLIFGGGQVLVPALYAEFVQFKKYLTHEEFLSGYAIAQTVPGPVFAFSSLIGVLTMRERGLLWQIAGGLVTSFAIFLPGTLLIFFVINFWEQLKRYRPVRASLEGIHAASAGLMTGGALAIFTLMPQTIFDYTVLIITALLVLTTKIPYYAILLAAIFFGFILE
jgi:chromate transporter